MIGVQIPAKKHWRQRKKNKKCVKNLLQLASPSVSCQQRGKSPDVAEQQDAKLSMVRETKPTQKPEKE